MLRVLPLAFTLVALSPAAFAQSVPTPSSIGVNLAGADFGAGQLPGALWKDYVLPAPAQLDYLAAKGCTVVRLPVLWERLQPRLGEALDESKMKELDDVLRECGKRNIGVLLDLHCYARYRDKIIGSPDVSVAQFADVWKRLALRLKDAPGMWAFGLANEPHDMGDATRWPRAAQAATDAIRSTGARQWVFVAGDGWSGASFWRGNNETLDIADPQDRVVYEAHAYFDDTSGTYKKSFDDEKVEPNRASNRLAPFAAWLKAHKKRGFLGEFGVPGTDRRWTPVLQEFVAVLKREGIGGTYWAMGAWWGSYPLSAEPMDDFQTDRPQMKVLLPYLDGAKK